MSRHEQADLFAPDPRADLLGEDWRPRAYVADPEKVRRRLQRIMAEARAASTLPWDSSRASLYRTIVPQMTLWLPEDEAAQWRLDFETEMARFEEAA